MNPLFADRECYKMLRGVWWVVLIGCLIIVGNGIAQNSSVLTPREVVEQWFQVYPRHLEQAVELTNTNFREGVSKEEWIASQKLFLQNLGMKYVRAKIAHEEMIGEEAHVIVHAHIATLMGDHPQDELYILHRDLQNNWLVNAIEVYTESFNRLP